MLHYFVILTFLFGSVFAFSQKTETQVILNPICPVGVYIADPEVRQMPDGRIYLYGSRDEPHNAWCSHSYNILSTTDLVHWSVEQNSFATRGVGKQTDYMDLILYAPDCIFYKGKYYLFYCTEGGNKDEVEGVAVSDSPYGPFKNGKKISGAFGIDPTVFIDDDGTPYLYWGQGYAKGAKLSKDLMNIEGKIQDSLLTYEKHFFNEGGSMRKRNGIYYYVYASHQRHGESNCATLSYATSKSPLGPFTYRGNIIDNWGSGKNLVNNHGCITEINGKWYVFYHRPTHGSATMRKACAEPITFNTDGSINEVEMTTNGIGALLNPLHKTDAARACLMNGNVFVKERRLPYDVVVDYLSDIQHNDWALWRYFDFTKEKATQFTCKIFDQQLSGDIEIRIDSEDGELIGKCKIPPNNENVAYTIHSTQVKSVTGKHAVVLVFKAKNENDKSKNLFNIEWFIFEKK